MPNRQIMGNPLVSGRQETPCAHRETITGTAGGIKREVCKDCGNVSVSHVRDPAAKSPGDSDSGEKDQPE